MTLSNHNLEIILRTLGQADMDQLGLINQEAIRQLKITRRIHGQSIAKQLIAGVAVQISGTAKPKYLANQTGEVVEVKDRRALVKLDQGPQGKFRTGKVLCPFEMLTVI